MSDESRLRLVACTQDYVILHKPAGVPFHNTSTQAGLLTRLREAWPTLAGEETPDENSTMSAPTFFATHRLDQITSGLVFLARHKAAAQEFGRLLQTRQVEKYYIALAHGRPQKKQGSIIGDMERARRGNWKLTRQRDNPAVTRFVSQAIPALGTGIRLYLLSPWTGRTHQLRVALKSIGASILGDPRYATPEARKETDRTYLHAYALRFPWHGEIHEHKALPNTGIHFLSPLFLSAWESWGQGLAAAHPSLRPKTNDHTTTPHDL